MALAMVAEDKQINRVLEELFAEEVRVFSPSGNFSFSILTEDFNLIFNIDNIIQMLLNSCRLQINLHQAHSTMIL